MPVEALAAKMLSDIGELTAIVTILHDRTEAIERNQLYEQLKLASEELEGKVREATGELANQNELLRGRRSSSSRRRRPSRSSSRTSRTSCGRRSTRSSAMPP